MIPKAMEVFLILLPLASAQIFTNHLTELQGPLWNRLIIHLSVPDRLNKSWLWLFCIYSTLQLKASKCFVCSIGQHSLLLPLNAHMSGAGSARRTIDLLPSCQGSHHRRPCKLLTGSHLFPRAKP